MYRAVTGAFTKCRMGVTVPTPDDTVVQMSLSALSVRCPLPPLRRVQTLALRSAAV